MPEQSNRSPMLAITAAIPKRMLDMAVFPPSNHPLDGCLNRLRSAPNAPFGCATWSPSARSSRTAMRSSLPAGDKQLNGPQSMAAGMHGFSSAREAVRSAGRGARGLSSCADTTPALKLALNHHSIAVGSRPPHLSEGTPQCGQVPELVSRRCQSQSSSRFRPAASPEISVGVAVAHLNVKKKKGPS